MKLDEKTAVQDCTDWTGPDDEANPINWSYGKRVFHTAVPTVYAFVGAFGSSVFTPGQTAVQTEFGVSREVALLPFVIYLLGQSLGPMIAAPISETFGRRITYIASLPGFVAFVIGAGFSRSIGALVVTRFFAGMFSSVGLSVGAGTISELWPPHQRPIAIAIWASMTQFGPAIGDVVGSFVTEKESWRWTQWTICFGIAVVVAMMAGMSETYKTTILQKRAKKLGVPGPPGPGHNKSVGETVQSFATHTLARPLHMLLTEPIVTLFDLYIAFNFGLFNAFFAAFAYVFETAYSFDIGSTGLTYLGEAVGTLAGLCIIALVSRVRDPRHLENAADPSKLKPPEHRLLIAQIGAPMLPISLFWFGWTARPSIHWISPVAAEALYGCGNLLVFTAAGLYLTDCYGAVYGASAWSSTTSLRYLFAFAFPMFADQMYKGLGIGWASSLLAFCQLVLVPIPFLFGRYGERLRERSSYCVNET